jgi:hypothetical protein
MQMNAQAIEETDVMLMGDKGTVTMGDILHQLAAVDQKIEDYYATVRDESSDNNVRFCTYFLRRQQRSLLSKLAALELDGDAKSSVLTKGPDVSTKRLFPSLLTPPEHVTEIDLLKSAVTYEKGLMEVESELSDQSPAPKIVEFLTTLVESSKRDISMLNKVIAMKSAS